MTDLQELSAQYAAMVPPEPSPDLTPPARALAAAEEAPPRNAKAMAEGMDAEPKADKKDPRTARSWTFSFEHKTPGGEAYKATFTNTVLSIDKRLKAAALESQLIGGVPYESVDPLMGNVAKGVAHLTFSLGAAQNQEPSGWADNLLALDEPGIVISLFSEVLGHEETFRGLGSRGPGGESAGGQHPRGA